MHRGGGTNLEPDPRAPLRLTVRRGDARAEPSQRPESRRITYRAIRAYIYARHGFSPRTGWIAHVKELSGLTLRPTHNRRDPTRADPCPPRRRADVEEALPHLLRNTQSLHCQPTIGWNAPASIASSTSDTSRWSRTLAARSRVVKYRCSSLPGLREHVEPGAARRRRSRTGLARAHSCRPTAAATPQSPQRAAARRVPRSARVARSTSPHARPRRACASSSTRTARSSAPAAMSTRRSSE